MAKIIPSKLSKIETNKMLDLFYAKIAALKTKKEITNFLSDVLTESEQIMILRRLQIAKLLLEGETYFNIKSKLRVGLDTIKAVRYKLDNGRGGYLKFIKSLRKPNL